jgi:hypothetical protein
MSEPNLSTLPERMRYAAEVLEEVTSRARRRNVIGDLSVWSTEDLWAFADEWETWDEENAKPVEELAQFIHEAPGGSCCNWDELTEEWQTVMRGYARKLIESGWHK